MVQVACSTRDGSASCHMTRRALPRYIASDRLIIDMESRCCARQRVVARLMLTLACARREQGRGWGVSGGREDERSGCVQRRPLDLESVEKQYVRACCAWRGAAADRPRVLPMPSLMIGFPPFFLPLRRRSAAKKTKKVEAAKNAKSGGVVGSARAKDVRGGAGAGQLRVKPGTAAAAARS